MNERFEFEDEVNRLDREIESVKDDLEYEIDKKAGELREIVFSDPNRIRSNVEMQLQELSYPYGLVVFLSKYRKSKKSNVKLVNEIKKKYKCQFSLLKNTHYTSSLYTENSVRIRSGKELLDYSRSASSYIKPMLVYYGISQVYSGLINIFIDFSTRKHHGLKKEDESWNVELIKNGFFTKLTIFLEIFGQKSIFQPCLYNDSTDKSYIYRDVEKFIDYSKEILDLNELNIEFKKSANQKLVSKADHFLLNFINTFYFCSLSRYEPETWHNILKGTEYAYKIVEKTYREVDVFIYWFIQRIQDYIKWPRYRSIVR